MPGEIKSFDGVYLAADQGDRNFVVYDTTTNPWTPVWDRWSHESEHGNPTPNPDLPIIDTPTTPSPMIPSNPVKLIEGVNPIGMSYWRNINYHAGRNTFMVALSINDQLRVLTVDKNSLQVVDDKSLGIHHTGEGIYFSVSRHDILYVPLDGALFAVNIYTGDRAEIWRMPGKNLWQIHSSFNEDMHSATVKDQNWNIVGWAVHGIRDIVYPIVGPPDECQIDKSGEYLIIKEGDYNRIIHIMSGNERIIQNPAGALGHSDCGFKCMMGENDYSNSPGALDLINLDTLESRLMFSTGIWNMGYVSFTNAHPTRPNQICLVTTPDNLIKVNFDWPHEATIICPNLTQSQEYEHRPKANLCPLGEYAVWTAFVENSLNAYVVRVP